ncbi:MAG: hypothetical protein Phog2KO_30200 [Phototrophicaceae bacterium]
MQKLLAVAFTDLRIFLADKGNLVGLLLIPTVLTVVLGLVGSGGGSRHIRIAIINEDTSAQAESFIEDVADINDNFDVFLLDDSEQGGRQRVVNGNYDALIVIPTGFGQAIENFDAIDVRFYSNEDPTSPSIIEPSIQAIIGRLNGSIVSAQVGANVAENVGVTVDTDAIYQRANAILSQEPVQFDYQLTAVPDDDSSSGFNQSVPGMGTMFVMFTILGGMAVLIREREQWTLQRLVVMPVRRAEIIGGKILAYFTLGMIQYAVVFAIGLAFGMDFGNNWLGILLIAMAFSLATTALTFAVATRLRSQGQASQLTTLLALALASIGGAWWPLEIVPDFMKFIGHISPVAWAMDGFQDILFYDRGLIEVLPEVGVLLLIAGGLFVIGIMGFKYE